MGFTILHHQIWEEDCWVIFFAKKLQILDRCVFFPFQRWDMLDQPVNVANEGFYRDSLLKTVHNPGGDSKGGEG